MARRISSSDIAAIAASVTAVAALIIAAWDNVQQREFNRLSVLPRVNSAFVQQGTEHMRLHFSNQGVGPALLRSIRVAVCGGDREFDSWTAAQGRLEELGVDVIAVNDFNPGEALGIGASITALIVQADSSAGLDGSDAGDHDPMKRFRERTALELVYESIYGETFSLVRNESCLPGNPA